MNQWNILLERRDDGFTIATVLEVPQIQTTDKTKQGAIKKVQQLLQKRLAKAEIIQISLPRKSSNYKNSLMNFAGIFEDDPDFQEVMLGIRAEREDTGEA